MARMAVGISTITALNRNGRRTTPTCSEVARGNSKATFPAVGADFWNLSNYPTQPVSCEIGTHTPQVLSVVQRDAPTPPPPPPVSKNQLRMPTGVRLRGVNIVPTFTAVTPADQGSVWSAMWRTWDWAGWLQPQIDDAAKIGNAVRFFGNTHCIAIGTVTGQHTWPTGGRCWITARASAYTCTRVVATSATGAGCPTPRQSTYTANGPTTSNRLFDFDRAISTKSGLRPAVLRVQWNRIRRPEFSRLRNPQPLRLTCLTSRL